VGKVSVEKNGSHRGEMATTEARPEGVPLWRIPVAPNTELERNLSSKENRERVILHQKFRLGDAAPAINKRYGEGLPLLGERNGQTPKRETWHMEEKTGEKRGIYS